MEFADLEGAINGNGTSQRLATEHGQLGTGSARITTAIARDGGRRKL